MLLLSGRRERTRKEFQNLLAGADFALVKIHPTATMHSVEFFLISHTCAGLGRKCCDIYLLNPPQYVVVVTENYGYMIASMPTIG